MKQNTLQSFKDVLQWTKDESWFDFGGLSILMYAVCADEVKVVEELLKLLVKECPKGSEYTRRLESRVRDEGYVRFGIPGGMTTLMTAMSVASSEVVTMLLECGANTESVDVLGNDSFMCAGLFGRAENLECWLERVRGWNFDRKSTLVGGCTLGHTLYIGTSKLDSIKVLLNAGCNLDYRTHSGSSVLMNAVANEDSDPNVLRLILEKLKNSCTREQFLEMINYRRKPTTLKWKSIHFVARMLYRTGLSQSLLIRHMALESGGSVLHSAVERGDIEIVKILLENDADPLVKNTLGMDAFDLCNFFGPFPRVLKALHEHDNDSSSSSSSTGE